MGWPRGSHSHRGERAAGRSRRHRGCRQETGAAETTSQAQGEKAFNSVIPKSATCYRLNCSLIRFLPWNELPHLIVLLLWGKSPHSIDVITWGNVQYHIISWNTPLRQISSGKLAWHVEKGQLLLMLYTEWWLQFSGNQHVHMFLFASNSLH